MNDMRWRVGGCHCGAVRFEALLPDRVEVEDCNCSMCAKTGFLHMIVPASRFRVTAGLDQIEVYAFNSGVAKHLFCKICGVKAFYVPRSNPDGFSVNYRCLDDGHGVTADIVKFDGRNWEANAAALAHKSQT
jgi:hypothetical protein